MNAPKETALLSKLSLKGIGAQPKKGSMKEGDKEKTIAYLYGRTHGYEVGQTQFGEFTKFKGSFEAVNAETQERFKAGKILLPRIVEDLLREALDGTEEGSALDFALAVGVKYADSNFGYEYTVKPLIDMKESDELAALRNALAARIPMLAAPVTDSAPAVEEKGGKKK